MTPLSLSSIIQPYTLTSSLTVITSYSIHYTKLYESLTLIMELGPVLTALMVAGRAGSAICAELGIMRISEQIDALECMAVDPFRYFITPKFLATLISVPLLTAVFDVVGIAGGYVAGVGLMDVSPVITSYSIHYTKLYDTTSTKSTALFITVK